MNTDISAMFPAPQQVEQRKLPGLKMLGDLAEHTPSIIIDTREQTPLVFSRMKSEAGTLQTGDYSITGCEEMFAVERKSIADLVGCCMGSNRERFERELHRLRGYRFKRLLVVGNRRDIELHNYHSKLPPAAVLATLNAFEVRYDVPVVFADQITASELIEDWAWYYVREVVLTCNNVAKRTKPVS